MNGPLPADNIRLRVVASALVDSCTARFVKCLEALASDFMAGGVLKALLMIDYNALKSEAADDGGRSRRTQGVGGASPAIVAKRNPVNHPAVLLAYRLTQQFRENPDKNLAYEPGSDEEQRLLVEACIAWLLQVADQAEWLMIDRETAAFLTQMKLYAKARNAVDPTKVPQT